MLTNNDVRVIRTLLWVSLCGIICLAQPKASLLMLALLRDFGHALWMAICACAWFGMWVLIICVGASIFVCLLCGLWIWWDSR